MKKIGTENFIGVSVNESTDFEQRFVASFVFDVLNVERVRGISYLFAFLIISDDYIKWRGIKNKTNKTCSSLEFRRDDGQFFDYFRITLFV